MFPTHHRVYVLRDPSANFSSGLSDAVRARLHQHNVGLSRWTDGKGPWSLIWTNQALPLFDAHLEPTETTKREKADTFHAGWSWPGKSAPVGLATTVLSQ